MNISLTKHYDEFVENKIKSGRYESRSEVIRAALRIMETVEAQQDPLPYIPNLEEKLLRGLESPASPLTKSDWQNLRKRVQNRLRSGGRAKK
jgi:antitoxin ParD1/3/4